MPFSGLKHVEESQQFDRELLELVFKTADEMKQDLISQRRLAKFLDGKITSHAFLRALVWFQIFGGKRHAATRRFGDHHLRRCANSPVPPKVKVWPMNTYGERLRRCDRHASQRGRQCGSGPRRSAGCRSSTPATESVSTRPRRCWTSIPSPMPFPDGRSGHLVGDLRQGRTARSLSYLLTKYENIKLIFVSPPVCRMEGDFFAHLDK